MRISISVTKSEYEAMAKVYEAMGQEEMARQMLQDKTSGGVMDNAIMSIDIQHIDEHVVVTYDVNPEYSVDIMNIAASNATVVTSIMATIVQVVELSKSLVSNVTEQIKALNQKYLNGDKKDRDNEDE